MNAGRERAVTKAFVSIADSLVDGCDVLDLYTGLTADCAALLDIGAVGLLLADSGGVLHLMADSSERVHNLELFQLQREQGPCLDCFRTGLAVTVPDLTQEAARWPVFVPAALAAGFVSVHAVPMRLKGTVLGTLGLFGTGTGVLKAEDLALAQALAHVASVALVTDKAIADKDVINEQLQTALRSRVTLEQAKGLLAQSGDLDMAGAFAVLRRYSRDHNRRLADIAQAVVTRTLATTLLLDHARTKGVIALGGLATSDNTDYRK